MPQLPRPLGSVLGKTLLSIDQLMSQLEGGMDVDPWYDQFSAELTKYHTAAMLVGQQTNQLSEQARSALGKILESQLSFLGDWKVEIQKEEDFLAGWHARAALYAEAVKQSYWTGATRFLPLPAMPGDGTSQCLGNCHCIWDIVWIDEDNGDADCIWVTSGGEHCQTCVERGAEWAPLKVRGGVLL